MQAIMQPFDAILNRYTMYRGMLYGLGGLLSVALILAATGTLSVSAGGLALSIAVLTAGCYAANWLLAKLFRAAANTESWLITALILACILPPVTSIERAGLVLLTGCIAMASKYVLVWRGTHIFNPAAIAAFVVSTTGILPVTWWIANPTLTPFLIVGALVILRKHHRFIFFGVFAAVAVATMVYVMTILQGEALSTTLHDALVSWPIIFMGSIMLTEPATMPPTTRYQLIFAALVGVIFGAQLHLGPFDSTPQAALIIGNLFTFLVAPAFGGMLRLQSITPLPGNQYELRFAKPKDLQFSAGQYMQWTLPHRHSDTRGNRRTFSLSSSPTETGITISTRTYTPSSSFKTALLAMKPGQVIRAAHVAGSFTLPHDTSRPILFIAGGIGITPVRSMVKYVIDSGQQRDMILIYTTATKQDAIYKDVFAEAAAHGLKTHYAAGRLDAAEVPTLVPDSKQRLIYLSGPNGMVLAYRASLIRQGIAPTSIKTDYFTGY